MTTTEIKKTLHQTIDNIQDPNSLEMVQRLIFELLKHAGSLDGKPLTQLDILRRCIEAEADIRNGRVSPIQDVKEHIKSGFGRK